MSTSATERRNRGVSLIVGLAALIALLVARWLEPSLAGHSTHLQLGMQPCTFLALTGWPCPMCGATTTWALLADGHVLLALRNQPFAALLFVLDASIAGIGLTEALWPRGRWQKIGAVLRPHEARIAVAFVVAMGIGWAWKIAAMWH